MVLPKFLPKLKKPSLVVVRRVVGDSMAPTMTSGAIVVGIRPRAIRTGDVVVVRHNGMEKIKRVHKMSSSRVFLVGDNRAHSTDSRDFGWVDIGTVIARIVWSS